MQLISIVSVLLALISCAYADVLGVIDGTSRDYAVVVMLPDGGRLVVRDTRIKPLYTCTGRDWHVWHRAFLNARSIRVTDNSVDVLIGSDWTDYASLLIRSGYAVATATGQYSAELNDAELNGRGHWICFPQTKVWSEVGGEIGIPAGVLYALGQNESKHLNGIPWPWTLNVSGKGYYFDDRLAAYQAADYLVKHGVNRFDIGPMQMNWKYHSARFNNNLWTALEPKTNITAAASYLRELLAETGSWKLALSYYHSRNKERGDNYFARFVKHFNAFLREQKV